jgi:hypothetical protein
MIATTPDILAGSIRPNPLPPRDFDARRATPIALVHYGLPRRPDPGVMPELAARWDEVFSRTHTHITPEFRPLEELIPGIGRHERPQPDAAGTTNSIWSGSVVTTGAADTFKSITGQWNVADVGAPKSGAGSWYSVSWIGIDGYGNSDVCQIGTVQSISVAANGNVSRSVYAWFEWYPNNWTGISNFPVGFGDTLTCLLCIQSPTKAGFNLLNVTTGVSTGFTFTAPAGTTLVGNTAEWIVERPGINGSTSQLADFGAVYFDGCIASTQANRSEFGGSGTLLDMVENGRTVTTAKSENSQLIKVSFTS